MILNKLCCKTVFFKIAILVFITIIGKNVFAGEGEIIRVTDFGVRANSFENASPGITRAILSAKQKQNVTILLPGGRIDLWPEGAHHHELYISNATEDDTLSKFKSIGFCLDSMNNVTIEGNNTLVILHGKMVSFALQHARNITVKNIRFDYDRPTMSELTLLSVTPNIIEASIHPDSKYFIDDTARIHFYGEGWQSNSFHTIRFSASTSIMTYSSFKPFIESKAVTIAPLRVRFEGNFQDANLGEGDVLTIRDPYRDNAGAFISRSADIRLENIGMQYMHGLGIVSQFSENITLFKVRVAPAENSGRIISSFADCFHFSGCKGKILIDSCYTSGSHDDPINVHGTHLQIVSSPVAKTNKLIVRFMHHQTWGFEAFFAGDSISFINPATLLSKGTAIVKSAKLINRREMELELENEMPLALVKGDCIENITWTPELTVRNSTFERTNTRGLLVTSRRKVLIENNLFYRTGMHAILIADDAAGWYESGSVQDVTIRNNRFIECGYNSAPDNYVINIAPENHEFIKNKSVHQHIVIENNEFKVFDTPLLSAKSVSDLVYRGNNIVYSDILPAAENKTSFNLLACKKVIIEGNVFPSDILPMIITSKMTKKDLRTNIPVSKLP